MIVLQIGRGQIDRLIGDQSIGLIAVPACEESRLSNQSIHFNIPIEWLDP